MTELLQRVMAELEKLPLDEQDAMSYDKPFGFGGSQSTGTAKTATPSPLRVYATRLLAELEDDRAWKARFQATTHEQWDRLAEMVRQQITSGETASLDHVFPPES